MNHRTVTAAAALVLSLTLAACSATTPTSVEPAGSSASSNSTPSAQPGVMFNDADVSFLTDMYPHHDQALAMAAMVTGRTDTPSVLALATKIKGEQQPEMDTITTLLSRFGRSAPSTGMNNTGMAGSMSAQDMSKLGTLTGRAFDQSWLTMMTQHHSGAIDMANTETADGKNADAKALATRIIAAQRAEITTMKALLAAL